MYIDIQNTEYREGILMFQSIAQPPYESSFYTR